MRESPRVRRLYSDRAALDQLAAGSSIFRFQAAGNPADYYQIFYLGRGLSRPQVDGGVVIQQRHEVQIRLGASYPRTMPEISWKSPVFHPNISSGGVVCLGGYGTYWTPSLMLDELCTMLWEMIRYANFDPGSPYNREAAAWVKSQRELQLPLDSRPLRDRLAGQAPRAAPVRAGRMEPAPANPPPRASLSPPVSPLPRTSAFADSGVVFLEPAAHCGAKIELDEIVTAEVVEKEAEILFIG